MNFFKHHIGDYDSDTSHLTWDEDMAYTRMMRAYYRRERPLPPETKEVCRLVRATSSVQRKAVETVLNEFFTLEDDGWHQKRCDEEIAEANRKAEQNREVGKLGGRPRKKVNPTETQTVLNPKPTDNPDGFDSVSRNNPSQTPDSRLQTPEVEPSLPQPESPTRPEPPEEPPHGSTPASRAVEIAVYLRQRGVVGANSFNPYVSAWGDDVRVTNEILDAAISKAHASLQGKPIGPNYLGTIIPDLLAPKPPKPRSQAMQLTAMTDAQRDELGKKLGIGACRAGENRDAYIARIRARQAEVQGAAA